MLISKGKAPQFPDIRGNLETTRFPVYVETKIDGETQWFAPTCLTNSSGKMRYDMPICREISTNIKWHGERLLGELHWGEGKAGDFYKIKPASGDDLNFTVFDVDLPLPYLDRHKWLIEHIGATQHVSVVLAIMALNKEQVHEIYNQYADEMGFEGAVIKSFDSRLIMGPCPWVKIKKKETLDLEVVQISTTQERIEVLYMDKRVGVKCLDKDKKDLKVGNIVEIEHQGILSGGGLRHPIFVRKRDDKCDA